MFRLHSINKWDPPGFYQRVIIRTPPLPRPHLRTPACLLLSSSITTPLGAMIVFLSLACRSHLPERAEKMLLSSSRYHPGLSQPFPSCRAFTPPTAPPFPSLTITRFFHYLFQFCLWSLCCNHNVVIMRQNLHL